MKANTGVVGESPPGNPVSAAPAEEAAMAVHHGNAILGLVGHSHAPRDLIETLYWNELKSLEPARIRRYLPVVTGRRVRDPLRLRDA